MPFTPFFSRTCCWTGPARWPTVEGGSGSSLPGDTGEPAGGQEAGEDFSIHLVRLDLRFRDGPGMKPVGDGDRTGVLLQEAYDGERIAGSLQGNLVVRTEGLGETAEGGGGGR